MTRFAYTVLLRLLAPILWLWMLLRARKAGGTWGVFSGPRFGCYGGADLEANPSDRVWIHAVSLGETRAAQPLIKALLARGLRILLTHTTPTGRAEGGRLFAAEIASRQLVQSWLPYDFPGSVRRFLTFFAPRLGILIEREVWPNLIHEATRQGIPVILVSARFSESSLRQSRWAYRALRRAFRSLDLVLAQTKEDADRLKAAGAHRPIVVGNMKFDVSLSSEQLAAGHAWRDELGRPVVSIASTREGEDAIFARFIADTIDNTQPASASIERYPQRYSSLYILVPRHPQRFDDAASILRATGLSFVRRSDGNEIPPSNKQILLGDSLGEMAFYYAASDVAIIGGGFVPLGGQNLIEACAAGTPVIVGPHMFNFTQATHDAVAAGAAIQVQDAQEALKEAWALLQDAPRREAMRNAALTWSATHAGATQRIMQALHPWIGDPSPVESNQGTSQT